MLELTSECELMPVARARVFDADFDPANAGELFGRTPVARRSSVLWSLVLFAGVTLLHMSTLTLCWFIDRSLRRLYRHARSTA